MLEIYNLIYGTLKHPYVELDQSDNYETRVHTTNDTNSCISEATLSQSKKDDIIILIGVD